MSPDSKSVSLDSMKETDKEAWLRRAAAYVRKSTDHQQYSTNNQMDFIREDARRRGLEIVKIFSDEGKSGLSIEGREGLKAVIAEIEAGQANYSCILVYDVSRWGRFQDPDESAYYEFVCRRAGIAVRYCAEPFENDGSPISTIIKGIKRAMAGEYSRELSAKVFQGACRLVRRGYKQGGSAGYGLRRMLVDQNGQRKGVLKNGEQKSIQTDRVICIPGPAEEIKVIREIFKMFSGEGNGETEIARILNQRGILSDTGDPWTASRIRHLLTNEKYIGNNVYHRVSFKLKQKRVVNPPEEWVRADGVFERVLDPELFLKARQVYQARKIQYTDEQLLKNLRELLLQQGHLNSGLIAKAEDMPPKHLFRRRFGSLVTAYRLVGFEPRLNYKHLKVTRRLHLKCTELVGALIQKIEASGGTACWNKRAKLLQINNELQVAIAITRQSVTDFGTPRWVVRVDSDLKPDFMIVVRMDARNEEIRDYYLFPKLEMTWRRKRLGEENGISLDAYRFRTLDCFMDLLNRVNLQRKI